MEVCSLDEHSAIFRPEP